VFDYDELARVSTVRDYLTGNGSSSAWKSFDVKYTQDGLDRRFRTTFSFADQSTGAPTPIDSTNTYDWNPTVADRLDYVRQFTTSTAEGQYAVKDRRIVNLEYFNNGEVKKITRWEGAVATADALITNVTLANSGWIQGRTGGISHTGKAGTVATQGYTWTNDVPGRITGSTITGSNPETKTFAYDSNDQLTGVTGSQTLSRTYDVNGNRTDSGVNVADNQLTNDGTYSYSYDKNGNRTQRTKLDGSYEKYTWDRRNRLTSVASYTITNIKTKEIQYQYDGLDRRIRRRIDANGNGVFTDAGDLQERFVYDTNVQNPSYSEVVQVLDESNNFAVKHRFLNGPALDQVFSDQTADGNILWLLQDNQQTVTDVADFQQDANSDGSADGKATLVNHLIYNALGQVTAADNPQTTTSTTDGILPGLNTAGSPQQAYTGQLYDPQTGLYYYDARWFDPFTNQFISEDPLSFSAGDTNLRRYVGNSNPNAVDPNGLVLYAFDGTGNDSDVDRWGTTPAAPSNIAILVDLYQGFAYYRNGVGTSGDTYWDTTGNAFGRGGQERLDTMMSNFDRYYKTHPDEPVDIIGFSRGAALARAFANNVQKKYPDAEIRFLGIFDTVAQFGLPGKGNSGKDLSISEDVGYTAHAVAEDEYRRLFPLTSIVDCSNLQSSQSTFRQWQEDLISGDANEIWLYPHEFTEFKGAKFWEKPFAGAHSDIGGGYQEFRNIEAIKWMIAVARARGVPFKELSDYPHKDQISDIPASGAHDSRWKNDYIQFRWNWRKVFPGNLSSEPCKVSGGAATSIRKTSPP